MTDIFKTKKTSTLCAKCNSRRRTQRMETMIIVATRDGRISQPEPASSARKRSSVGCPVGRLPDRGARGRGYNFIVEKEGTKSLALPAMVRAMTAVYCTGRVIPVPTVTGSDAALLTATEEAYAGPAGAADCGNIGDASLRNLLEISISVWDIPSKRPSGISTVMGTIWLFSSNALNNRWITNQGSYLKAVIPGALVRRGNRLIAVSM